jgi:CHASE2 domain-containing sensor protein
VTVQPDPDGVVRRGHFGEGVGGSFVPSLASALAGGVGSRNKDFLIDFGIDAGVIDRISASELLDETVAADRIKGKKAIVGAQAVELRDVFLVPVHGYVSGAALQALATETLVQSRALVRSGALVSLAGLAIIAMAVLLAMGRLHWRRLVLLLLAAGLAIEGAATLPR